MFKSVLLANLLTDSTKFDGAVESVYDPHTGAITL